MRNNTISFVYLILYCNFMNHLIKMIKYKALKCLSTKKIGKSKQFIYNFLLRTINFNFLLFYCLPGQKNDVLNSLKRMQTSWQGIDVHFNALKTLRSFTSLYENKRKKTTFV